MDDKALLLILRDAQSPLVEQLSEIVADQLLATPIEDFLDATTFASVTTDLAGREQLARSIERHGKPGWQRALAHLARTEEVLGDSVPEATRRAILTMLQDPEGPRLHWLAGTLDRRMLRELLAPVFHEVLLGFVRKLRSVIGLAGTAQSPAEGSRHGGLFGRLGKDVGLGTGRRLLEVGRNMVGSLGLDVEERIQAQAKEFSGSASEAFRTALLTRLQSAEGRTIVRDLVEQGFDHIMRTPLSDIHADLQRMPTGAVLDVVPELWSYNLQRNVGQQILAQTASQWFAVEGKRPLASWLCDAGAHDTVRKLLLNRTQRQLHQLFAQETFAAWLHRLVVSARS